MAAMMQNAIIVQKTMRCVARCFVQTPDIFARSCSIASCFLVRGFGSINTAGTSLTPTLPPNGERERPEFAARACTAHRDNVSCAGDDSPRPLRPRGALANRRLVCHQPRRQD